MNTIPEAKFSFPSELGVEEKLNSIPKAKIYCPVSWEWERPIDLYWDTVKFIANITIT